MIAFCATVLGNSFLQLLSDVNCVAQGSLCVCLTFTIQGESFLPSPLQWPSTAQALQLLAIGTTLSSCNRLRQRTGCSCAQSALYMQAITVLHMQLLLSCSAADACSLF